MNVSIDVSEVDALAAELGEAGPKVQREAGDVVSDVRGSLGDAAQASAPVDTGELRASRTDTGEGLEQAVEFSAAYAAFVEFGTYKDAPQPFLFPHADRAEADLESKLGEIGDPFS